MNMFFQKSDALGDATIVAPGSVLWNGYLKDEKKLPDIIQTKLGIPIDFCLDFDALKSDSILNFLDDTDFLAASCELAWEYRKFYYRIRNETAKTLHDEIIFEFPSELLQRDFLVDILNKAVMSDKFKTKLFSFFDARKFDIDLFIKNDVVSKAYINFYNLFEKEDFFNLFVSFMLERRESIVNQFNIKL